MKIERGAKRLVRPQEGSSVREYVALSSADFVVPSVHVELLLAYEAAPPTSALEEGLQKVLGDYREWAGRILPAHAEAGRPVILLNDAGAAFIEAQGQGPIHDMLPFNPSLLLRDLVPPHFGAPELLLVQVTRFTCGGMALGVAWQHQVADGEAALDFIKAWTLRAQGLPILFSSSQDRSFLMGKDCPHLMYDHIEFKRPLLSKINAQPRNTLEKQDVVVRKLHFSADLLKEIKKEATREGQEFTRFESLMGHLWRCITRARGLDEEDGQGEDQVARETRLTIAVNARKRMDSKIGEGYFGNVICPTCASAKVKQLAREPSRYGARLVKEAIKKVNESFVRSTLDYVEIKERRPFEGGRTDGSVLSPNLSVTSWATLPLYQLDFGFGTPFFAGNAYIPFEGLLIILPSPLNDGSLDVVLGLFAPAMDKLLSSYQLVF